MQTQLSIVGSVVLSDLGVIRARGADAAKFLQGQLTNDVMSLDLSRSRLAGFCSAKGRLQASFLIWKAAPDEFLLACSASLLGPTLKRLSMFVMRAQCKLSDASDELTLRGVVGDSARTLIGETPVWGKRDAASGTLLRLPDAVGLPRAILASTSADGATDAPAISLDQWRWLDVQSGVPTIEATTVDQFVPQMLNYEVIGGVDFQKGCYPGQEVVARSHYRGTVKRRMFLFETDAAASPGQEVFHSEDTEQPAGMVVNAAAMPDRAGSVALVALKLAALERGSVHLGSGAGAVLHRVALPYPLPADAELPG
ncbi:MAG: folate-binding protein [Burkholderiaceae bacterium]